MENQISRRDFGKRSLATIATMVLASVITIPAIGCSVDVKGLVNIVIESVEGILAVAAPGEAWAADLKAALTALQNAETQWTAGGAVALVEDALNTISAVVAVIPLTAPYAPLVAILVAGIDAVLNALSPASATPAVAGKLNVYTGRVALQKPHLFQTQVGAYRDQWNSQAKALGLTAAIIK